MQALQRAIADACLSANDEEKLARDLRGFLDAHGVAPGDVEAILLAPRRLAVYRSLVRNGISSVVARILARTRARMNAASAGRFDADFARFVDEEGPRTHYLRDVPAEFFAWVEPRWRADPGLPAYLVDLASHELTHFAVAACAIARRPDAPPAVALDRPLAFVESARATAYRWTVHELSGEADATDVPVQRDVRLLVYRDADHLVRWLDLTPLAAAIVGRLLSGDALGVAVEAACLEHETAPAQVLSDIALLLADLAKRGVIVGARAS
jgi:hypothetical protein